MTTTDSIALELEALYEQRKILIADQIGIKSKLITNHEKTLKKQSELRNVEPILITITENKNADIIKGNRCNICQRPSLFQCFTCKQNNKPSGFCYQHLNRHNSLEHNPIMIPTTIIKIKPQLTVVDITEFKHTLETSYDLGEIVEQCKKFLEKVQT